MRSKYLPGRVQGKMQAGCHAGTPEQGQADRVLVLSDADRAALNAQASRGLLLALAAQGAWGSQQQ